MPEAADSNFYSASVKESLLILLEQEHFQLREQQNVKLL